MPVQVENTVTVGGKSIESPWVGPVEHRISIAVDLDGLATDEIDANGYLKAGVPLTRAGALVTAVGAAVYGCVMGNTKVAKSNSAADRTAAGSPQITVGLVGTINRDVLEDSLGRVLTANEIAGFAIAGSLIKLLD